MRRADSVIGVVYHYWIGAPYKAFRQVFKARIHTEYKTTTSDKDGKTQTHWHLRKMLLDSSVVRYRSRSSHRWS